MGSGGFSRQLARDDAIQPFLVGSAISAGLALQVSSLTKVLFSRLRLKASHLHFFHHVTALGNGLEKKMPRAANYVLSIVMNALCVLILASKRHCSDAIAQDKDHRESKGQGVDGRARVKCESAETFPQNAS